MAFLDPERRGAAPIDPGGAGQPAAAKGRGPAEARWIVRFAVLYLALSVFPVRGAESSSFTEYNLKAAQIYGIAKFIHWPETAFDHPRAPVVFAVFGKDPFGSDLEEILKDKTLSGRPIIVKRTSQLENLMPCHILFVASSEEKRVDEILEAIRGRPILTVGDMARFPERGGILKMVMEGRRVAFEINLPAASRASLTVESRLSKLARTIHDDPQK